MEIQFWIAQVIGVVACLNTIVAVQFPKKRQIMICYTLSNFLHAINLFLLGGYSGVVINIVAAFQTMINTGFDEKNRKIPIWLIVLYLILSVSLSSLAVASVIDVLPIICAILYIVLITVKAEKSIRRITFLNVAFWFIYDCIVKNYSVAIFDFVTMISTLIGMYRYDFKKEKMEGEKNS